MLLISAIIALLALTIGSYTDFQKREVHDYISYGLIFIAFGISIINTIIVQDYKPLIVTSLGFLIGMGIAYAMFYMGQWGGGDSKLIMGLGAILGFNAFRIFGDNNFDMIIFLVNIVLVGAVYGLVFSTYLAIKHRKEFMKTLKKWTEKKEIRIMRLMLLALVILGSIIILLFIPKEFKLMILSLIALLFIIYYMWMFVKIIEESCMIKPIPVNSLTEGDWVNENIYSGKKYLAGPKDLGITKEQIQLLKKHKIKSVTVKEGIPFIPAFLIAFIATLLVIHLKLFIL